MEKSNLHDYQVYSKNFIISHPIAAILLDCGLGKTVTSLTAIEELMFDYFEFAEFKILDMGARLGRFIGQYRMTYFKPDKMNGPIVYSYKPMPGAEKAIYEKISDITISMKAKDHLKMPELINSKYLVNLSEKEKKKYEDMKAELVLALPEGEITAANAASLSGKLSQMANGAVYADDESIFSIHERKLDALEDIIEAANGKTVLGISIRDLDLLTIGMVNDMYAKSGNDDWNYNTVATQADFDVF